MKKKDDQEINRDGAFFDKLELYGLNYIKKNKNYLKVSIIFPFFSLIVIFFNVVFLFIGFENFKSIPIIGLMHIIPSLCLSFTLSLFSFIQFNSLKKWNRKLRDYENFYTKNKENILEKKNDSSPSLINMFYEIVDHMDRTKYLFYLLNLFSFLYVFWYFNAVFFLIHLTDISRYNGPVMIPFPPIIDFISIIVLIIYIALLWKHFWKWNKKLNQIQKYEHKIAEELELIKK